MSDRCRCRHTVLLFLCIKISLFIFMDAFRVILTRGVDGCLHLPVLVEPGNSGGMVLYMPGNTAIPLGDAGCRIVPPG